MKAWNQALSALLLFLSRRLSSKLRCQYETLSIMVNSCNHQAISRNIINALIAAEDRRYLTHSGFDLRAVGRALWSIVAKRKLQGASTIEQQFVRTVTHRHEVTLARKLREIALAIALSGNFPKDQIARAYLCVAYFGWQMNGIDEACHRLSIDSKTATPAEAAEIVARLKYPEPQAANARRVAQIKSRVNYILQLRSMNDKRN